MVSLSKWSSTFQYGMLACVLACALGGGLLAACTTPMDEPDSGERPLEETCPPARMGPCPSNPQEECCVASVLRSYVPSPLAPATREGE